MAKFPETKPDWANLEVLHRNTLPPRANFNIYDNEKDALSRDVSKSRSLCLSGTWKFNLTDSPLEAPSGFETESFDSSKWDSVPVPGMWQLQGYGKGPQYTNVQFPFFVDPPNPPFADNECGSFITRFKVPDHLQNDQLRLRFEGVDSSFHLWLNGHEVGYSQGARNPSEFDITELVKREGENILAVRVYQYCDGSYIEDQDQWRMSGIFRDVYLLGFPKKARFEDITLQTILDSQYKDASLQVQVEVSGACKVGLILKDAAGKEIAADSQENPQLDRTAVNFSIPVRNPHKWTAETPYLYNMVLSLDDSQFVVHRVGFRQVELKDGLIKVNGKRVLFVGANRHEHHPKFGRTVPLEFLKQDLLLMKSHNLNSVRTCHQPSDTRLYDLADELGLWVMDEADLECHGFETIEDAALDKEQRNLPFFERQQHTKVSAAKWTSDNPEWTKAYVDRAKQLVYRDKLHPSVVMWSLGNEAFFGRNHVAMRDWIKGYDPTRLIHYEPDLEAEHMDMHSRMYPELETITSFGEDKTKTKPLVLCEYIHAMGTGPGNIKEYIDAFIKYPSLQGGWVWEWANHGLLTKNKDGEEYYGYGGDFGDVPNDYNFVMDGVLNSDHTPSSGLLEYKKAVEPVQVVSLSPTQALLTNRYDFATLDHLICKCSALYDNGERKDVGTVDIPAGLHPGGTATVALPSIGSSFSGEAFIELSFQLKHKTLWAEAGHEVAWSQLPISPPRPIASPKDTTNISLKVEKVASVLNISNTQCQWKIDLARGVLTSWAKNGHELLARPLEPSFYRAPTDNDAPQDGADWKERLLHLASLHTSSVNWHETPHNVIVTMTQKFGPKVLSWSLDLETEYTFSPSGSLALTVKGKPKGRNLPKTLPRIGMSLGLPRQFQQVSWFGRGPGEGYRDMKLSQKIDSYSVPCVQDLWTGPEFPQECSNTTDTRWVRLSSSSEAAASLTAEFFTSAHERRLFDFMACHYDVRDIDEAQHPFELESKRQECVLLRLDAEHHGLGTGSCGPKTLEEYALKMKEFEFSLLLY